jgi:hypothetical protein
MPKGCANVPAIAGILGGRAGFWVNARLPNALSRFHLQRDAAALQTSFEPCGAAIAHAGAAMTMAALDAIPKDNA